MTLPATRTSTAVDLAGRINSEHRAAMNAATQAVEHAVAAGRMLAEAKEACGHGNWLAWMGANFEGSPRTAQGYMRLARAADTQGLAHLGIEAALRQLAAPPKAEEPTVDDIGFDDADVSIDTYAAKITERLIAGGMEAEEAARVGQLEARIEAADASRRACGAELLDVLRDPAAREWPTKLAAVTAQCAYLILDDEADPGEYIRARARFTALADEYEAAVS